MNTIEIEKLREQSALDGKPFFILGYGRVSFIPGSENNKWWAAFGCRQSQVLASSADSPEEAIKLARSK
jgi:hypothetical protein